MTPDENDMWRVRRRLGETLRRWASSARAVPRAGMAAEPPARHGHRSEPPSSLGFEERPNRDRAAAAGMPPREHQAGHDAEDRTLHDALHDGVRRCVCRRGKRLRRRDRDRGAATIFVLAVGLVLVAAGVAAAAVGAARIGRHQAQIAADLGALAGAARAVEGEAAACAQAARFAAANDGLVTSCHLEGLDIVLRTDVTLTPLPGMTRHARGAARAGPVYAIPFSVTGPGRR
jgi:secretion/DNA translocation related TadE-like protein